MGSYLEAISMLQRLKNVTLLAGGAKKSIFTWLPKKVLPVNLMLDVPKELASYIAIEVTFSELAQIWCECRG